VRFLQNGGIRERLLVTFGREIVSSTRKHRYLLLLTPKINEVALSMKEPYLKRATTK
jgi:hypothetical protein